MKLYISKILDGMAKGLFASLIVGTVLFEFGEMLNIELLTTAGSAAKLMMGPAIAVGIATKMNLKPMAIASAVIIGALTAGTITAEGATIGDPLTCLIGSTVVLELIRRLEKGKTFDIFLIPALAIILSAIMFEALAPVTMIMNEVSLFINNSVNNFPILGSAAIALMFALFISGPLSSAALAYIIGIEGTAAFIAVVATSSQMAGFFIMSIKDNGIYNSTLILFGSSKLQLKNIALNKYILIPPVIASVVCGVFVSLTSNITSVTAAAGMGNCALIGPLLTIEANNYSTQSIIYVLLFCFIIPMIITYIGYKVMVKKNMIKKGDLCL